MNPLTQIYDQITFWGPFIGGLTAIVVAAEKCYYYSRSDDVPRSFKMTAQAIIALVRNPAYVLMGVTVFYQWGRPLLPKVFASLFAF